MGEATAVVSSSEGKETQTEVVLCHCNCDLKTDDIKCLFTTASDARLKEIIDAFNEYDQSFEITSCLRRAHFFAQIREECGSNLTAQRENLNYSVEGLKLFNYFKEHSDEAELYGRVDGENGHAADCEAIANRAYANRLGNGDVDCGDGWKFRGGGLIQLTGKDNYKVVNDTIKKQCPSFTTDITGENITNAKESVISAMAYWYKNKLNTKADGGTTDSVVDSITKVVNAGTESYDARKKHFKTIKEKWKIDDCSNK